MCRGDRLPAAKSMADKRRKCLENKADGLFGRDKYPPAGRSLRASRRGAIAPGTLPGFPGRRIGHMHARADATMRGRPAGPAIVGVAVLLGTIGVMAPGNRALAAEPRRDGLARRVFSCPSPALYD